MAANLVSTIAQVLSPELLGRIASALGLDKSIAQKAVSAGVPALLAAFSSRASSRDGAERLNSAIANQQPGAHSMLANALGGSSQNALIDAGRSTLTSLLGGSATDALASAIDSFAGTSRTASQSLLGILGPVAMSVVGQQCSPGVEASQILASQKENIANAVPAGFAKYLNRTGILDAVTGSSVGHRTPSEPVHAGSRAASYAVEPTGRSLTHPLSELRWLLPALALAALGALAWSFLSGPNTTKTVEATRPITTGAPIETGALKAPSFDTDKAFAKLNGVKVGDIDLGAQLTNAVNELRGSLEGIKDEATARTAIPALTNAGYEFDKVTALSNQLTPETRRTLASAIAAVKPALDQLFDKALAIPAVGSAIKPTVDTIRSKLDTLATA